MGECFKSPLVCFGLESKLEPGSSVRVPGGSHGMKRLQLDRDFPEECIV